MPTRKNSDLRAYCGGTFDLFHPGHVRFFRWAKESFKTVIAALNTDEFVAEYKGHRPVQSYEERKEMLEACRYIDEVVPNLSGRDSRVSVLKARAEVIVNSSDWTREHLMRQMNLSEEFLTVYGLSIVLCPLPREFSTTELKERVNENRRFSV